MENHFPEGIFPWKSFSFAFIGKTNFEKNARKMLIYAY